MNEARAFGDLLRRHRRDAGLTQAALAERSGISIRAIAAMENGRRRWPRRHTLDALSTALDLDAGRREAMMAAARRPLAPGQPPSQRAQTAAWAAPLPLVGRRTELATARAMLDEGSQLVTLTGPPGVGKTRLAQAVVDDLAEPVCVVGLGSLTNCDLVGQGVRQALDLPEPGEKSGWDTLAEHLGARRLLLVLDTFEHVLPAAAPLAGLLTRCPGLRVLVTSRASLRIRAERELVLTSLPEADAVQMFVERARAVRPEFALGPANRHVVAAICQRLEGLPLALELAAPWLRVVPPETLLARLEHRLALLVDGTIDLPERQRTLRAALTWSCDLLSASQRRLLAALSVFAGEAPLEGIEAVAAALGEPESRVLLDLAELVRHSLVRRMAEPEAGVSVLDTVRDFAAELLATAGDAERAASARFDYYLGVANRAGDAVGGPTEGAWLHRLRREHPNLRMSLQWAAERACAERGLLLATALRLLWTQGGLNGEGLEWLERFLAIDDSTDAALRARALGLAGLLAAHLGMHDRAIAYEGQAIALHEAAGDGRGVGDATRVIGQVLARKGELAQGIAYLRRAVELLRPLGDDSVLAVALANLGLACQLHRDLPDASAAYEEALMLNRRRGHDLGVALCLNNLGDLARVMGDLDLAQVRADEAMAIARRLDSPYYVALISSTLADIARMRGNLADASLLYRECLRIAANGGERIHVTQALELLALLEAQHGDPLSATRLYGAAAAITPGRNTMDDSDVQLVERTRDDLKLRLGEAVYAAAFEVGRHLTIEQAVAEALALPEPD